MAKMMSNTVTLWWVPADTPGFDPAAPSAAALTEPRNISCAVVSGYTMNPTDSDTDGTTSICNDSNVSTPTFYNYEGNLTFFRQAEGVDMDVTAAYARAFEFFKHPDAEGWFVQREGYKQTVAAAAGQEVRVFKFISDNPQDVVPDDGGPIQMTVAFLPQGEMYLDVPLVA